MTQRPRDLTRQQLKELKLALRRRRVHRGHLQTAWRDASNQDIAATIIGYIRHAAIGEPFVPYKERVARRCRRSSPAARGRRRSAVAGADRQAAGDRDRRRPRGARQGQFKAEGGFSRLNRVFDGRLEAILEDIAEASGNVAA